MSVLRYANRVPLQFQAGACAITQAIMQHQLATLWAEPVARPAAHRPGDADGSHGQRLGPLHQRVEGSHRRLSRDPEGAAAGPQAVGRKLGMFLSRRKRVQHEGQRRSIFLRYLGEVASAVSDINQTDSDALYEQLLEVARLKTAEADMKLDDRGRVVEEEDEAVDFGGNVLIVPAEETMPAETTTQDAAGSADDSAGLAE